jgi:hypothetical protein
VELSNQLYLTFRNLGFKIKPPLKAPFYVLREAYVPAVLVEMGYLSNYQEEKILRRKYYQKQIAEAIAIGVTSLKKSYSHLPKAKVAFRLRTSFSARSRRAPLACRREVESRE